jgi:hypothetical protein
LLVHLGTRCNSIDGKIEYLLWLNNFVQSIDVSEDLFEHFSFIQESLEQRVL